jgi:H+/gluconate symporter-like permease
MFVAYRCYSVILFAPIAAMGAVLLTDPSLVPPLFSNVFMEKMVGFVKTISPCSCLAPCLARSLNSLASRSRSYRP